MATQIAPVPGKIGRERSPDAPTSRLKAPLEQLCREADWARRIDRDAIRYPLRYPDPADREIVALLSACLAYGRVDLFGPWIEWALARMGESPHRFMLGFDPRRARPRLRRVSLPLQPRARSRGVLPVGPARLERARLARRLLHARLRAGGRPRGPGARDIRGGLRRRRPLRRVPEEPALLRLPPLVSPTVHRRGLQAPASSSFAGWSGASRRTSDCGRACRRLHFSSRSTRTSRTWPARSASRAGAPATGRWPRRSRHACARSTRTIP